MADASVPRIALIFPPLVETNFARYFPSTAVLAAYLDSRGLKVTQLDLNEEFALYLAHSDRLDQFRQGRFPFSVAQDTITKATIAATLLVHNCHLLFDEQGRHCFRAPGVRELMIRLAAPFSTDPQIEQLTAPEFHRAPAVQFFETFFEQHVLAIPDTVVLIGISVAMGCQLLPALVLSAVLKRRRPDLVVVAGGPTFSLMALDDIEALLRAFQSISCIIRFDGELPLYTVAQQVIDGSINLDSVSGASFVDGDHVTHNPPGPGPRLDDLPFAQYDRLLMSRLAFPEIGVIQARGCYWGNCAYCDFIELYGGSPPYRTRSVQRFVDEVEYQLGIHGNHSISVITESIPASFASKLSTELQCRGLNVRWDSFAMVDRRFTDEVFRQLAAGGCSHLVIGMESMNDRVLALVGKSATREENIRFMKAAAQAGVPLAINIIPDLPTTTYDEAMTDLAIFKEHRRLIYSVSVFPFEATRSSAIGRNPGEFGLLQSSDAQYTTNPAQAQFAANHLHWHDPAMSRGERKQIIDAYRAFESDVNSHGDTADGTASDISTLAERDLTSCVAHIDPTEVAWCECDGILHTYCLHTRRAVHMTLDWKPLLEALSRRISFTFYDLVPIVGSVEQSRRVFLDLFRYRLAVECAPHEG